MSEITLSLNSLPAGPENMASTLAPMLYDATVNAPPPGVEAQAATGGALLLLAMATLEPLGAAPLGCRSAAAILQFLSRLTVTVILAIFMWASAAKPQRQYLQPRSKMATRIICPLHTSVGLSASRVGWVSPRAPGERPIRHKLANTSSWSLRDSTSS